MKIIFRPYCWFLSLCEWIKDSFIYGDVPYISGHEWTEVANNQKYQLLKCLRCGEEDYTYYKDNPSFKPTP